MIHLMNQEAEVVVREQMAHTTSKSVDTMSVTLKVELNGSRGLSTSGKSEKDKNDSYKQRVEMILNLTVRESSLKTRKIASLQLHLKHKLLIYLVQKTMNESRTISCNLRIKQNQH